MELNDLYDVISEFIFAISDIQLHFNLFTMFLSVSFNTHYNEITRFIT